MNKLLPLAIALLCSLPEEVSAQAPGESGDPHVGRFRNDALKNAGFIRFERALEGLARSARAGQSNSAAAKALFKRNSAMLRELYGKAGMRLPERGDRAVVVHHPEYMISQSAVLTRQLATPLALTFTKSGGYDFSWRRSAFPNGNMPMPFDTLVTGVRSGKQAIQSTAYCTLPSYCYIGLYQRGFGEKVTVPSDPQIIAARVKFDYSFAYDAWDSYGAKSAVDLLVRAGINFNSTAYNGLPDVYGGGAPTDRWKKLATLMPLDSVMTDYGEFHATADSSVTIEGYVTPGSDVDFRFGFGFPKGTHKGVTGNYHYAEFVLKKITVTYYKSSQ